MASEEISFYLRPGVMTTQGRYEPLFADLPGGVAALAAVAQGLVIHEFLAEAYGVTLSDLIAAYASDDRLRVPPVVRNAVLNRPDPVPAALA